MTLFDWLGCAAVCAPAALCGVLVWLGAFDEGRP